MRSLARKQNTHQCSGASAPMHCDALIAAQLAAMTRALLPATWLSVVEPTWAMKVCVGFCAQPP